MKTKISVNRIRAFNAEAFVGTEIPSLGMLTDGERKRLGRPIFMVPYVAVPEFCGENAIEELLDNLNSHPEVFESVQMQWEEFFAYFRELLDRHVGWYDTVRRIKTERYSRKSAIAVSLLIILNLWASGKLEYLRQCQHCGKTFFAKRETEIFHSGDCRKAFYDKVQSKTEEYRARKAREARVRRKNDKIRKLKELERLRKSGKPSK